MPLLLLLSQSTHGRGLNLSRCLQYIFLKTVWWMLRLTIQTKQLAYPLLVDIGHCKYCILFFEQFVSLHIIHTSIMTLTVFLSILPGPPQVWLWVWCACCGPCWAMPWCGSSAVPGSWPRPGSRPHSSHTRTPSWLPPLQGSTPPRRPKVRSNPWHTVFQGQRQLFPFKCNLR